METNLFTNSANAANAAGNGATVQQNGLIPQAPGMSANQEMFTKLLVAQIKNQDPLSPSDPAQFVQQLTQLSQTEALNNMAKLTSANASVLQSMQVLALGGQVGSDVMVSSDTVKLDGAKVKGEITLGNVSTKTTLILTGSNGVERPVELGSFGTGANAFTIDPAALGLPAGTYKMKVVTSSGEQPPLDIAGRLNSVRLGANGNVVLNVGNVGEVASTAITAFNGKSATTSATKI